MKQLIIANSASVTYGKNYDASNNVLDQGSLAILDGNVLLNGSSTVLKSNLLTIAMGDANNNIKVLAGIDLIKFRYTESAYQALTNKVAKITISWGTISSGNIYGICIIKKGCLLNERNKYYSEVVAMYNDDAASLSAKLIKRINASISGIGVATINSGNTEITITGNSGIDFDIQGCERFIGSAIAITTPFAPAINDKDYMRSLWLQCIGNNGNFYTDVEGSDLYKEPPFANSYKTLNMFFQSPRVGRQIVDQNVTQEVIISCINSAVQYATVKATIDTIISIVKAGGTISPLH